jgi:hypothetical protein
MAQRRSQKNKNTTQKEVILEILLNDCSNYASWSTSVINAFRTIDPRLEQIIDKSIIPSDYDASEEDQRCICLNHLALDILGNSLCDTNPCKEEENDRWRPNDESTSPRGLSSHFDSHICCVANENDSVSTNEDEEE